MTSEEFVEEVLNSEIKPDGFEELYQDFQRYQNLAFDTLKEFHRVCVKNQIRYQLAYGSLIGAVRDQGQIPWDYDIDVFVPYADKNKLVEAVKSDLDEHYYAWSPEIDPRCDHSLMRLAPKGYGSEALHVDVFYLIGIPDNLEEQKAFLKPVDKLYHARCAKMTNVYREAHGSLKKFFRILYKEKIKYLDISQVKAEAAFEQLCGKYPIDMSKYCAPATYGSELCIYETEKVLDTVPIVLQGAEFLIPRDYDSVLRGYYGDYTKIPPLEQRLKEMMRTYHKLLRYDQNKQAM